MGFVAVRSVKSSGNNRHHKTGKNYNISANYHISAILAVYLDGRLHALSFDILHATFLWFHVSVQVCHSVTDVSLSLADVTFPWRQWLFSRVFVEINRLPRTIDSTQVVVEWPFPTIKERTHVLHGRVLVIISLRRHFSELVNTSWTIWNKSTTRFRNFSSRFDISRLLMFAFLSWRICGGSFSQIPSHSRNWKTLSWKKMKKLRVSGKYTLKFSKNNWKINMRTSKGRNFQATERSASCKVQQLHNSVDPASFNVY